MIQDYIEILDDLHSGQWSLSRELAHNERLWTISTASWSFSSDSMEDVFRMAMAYEFPEEYSAWTSKEIMRFEVPAVPMAQPRQRHKWVGTHVINYTPAKSPVHSYKAAVMKAMNDLYDGPPIEGHIAVRMEFFLPRPKAMHWVKKMMPAWFQKGRPDIDNLQKSTKDALSKLAWRDDSQISMVTASKQYCSGDTQPRVRITISLLEALE